MTNCTRVCIAVCLLLLIEVAVTAASAQYETNCQGRPMVSHHCTMNLDVSGVCNGRDQVYFNIYRPWEDYPINITDLELSFYTTDTIVFAEVGNGYDPDIMMNLGRGMTHTAKSFPEPMTLEGWPDYVRGQWIDVHLACQGPPGVHSLGFLTVGYGPR